MSSADTVKKRKVECPDDTAQITAANEGGVYDIIAQMRSEMNDLKNANLMSQSRIDELENKCSSLERSIRILSKEAKWEYSAPDIPMSYWIDKGYDDDYSHSMKQFIDEMKSLTCQLRSGECSNDIDIDIGDTDYDSTLEHDDILLSHWKELVNALQLYQTDNDSDVHYTFSVDKLQLEPVVIDLLAPVMMGKSFKSLYFDENMMDNRSGIDFVVKCIRSNKGLTGFYWTRNEIESIEDAYHLLDVIIDHPSIVNVRFENIFGEDICAYNLLCRLLSSNKSYKQIDFEDNNIHTKGRTEIPDYIAANPPLENLFLAKNQLNDNDIKQLVRALKTNTNLLRLRLDYNDGTKEGMDALIKSVYNPTSFNAVSDCNHTCHIDAGINFGTIPYNSACPKKTRANKIYHLMSSRNKEGTNVKELNSEFDEKDESSMKLVPKVLECVHSSSPPMW